MVAVRAILFVNLLTLGSGIGVCAEPLVDFELDVQPILTKQGCNAGACHGKARGQNGFQLSLLAFDPDFDYSAIVNEGRGRRLFPADPSRSLLLRKPIGTVPHGGGKRLEPGGDQYRTLLRWIEQGVPRRRPEAPSLVRIEVDPEDHVLVAGESVELEVTAHYSDGSTRDVTSLAAYQSNESAVAKVDETGVVTTGGLVGEVAVTARYMNHFAVCTVAVPLAGEVAPETFAELPRWNFIDEHVWSKLERLRITPSDPAPPSKLVRRLYLDVIGRLPTPDEVRAFVDSEVPLRERRAALVDELLERPEFAEHWANKWVDLLRPNPYRAGIKATLNFDHWIRDQFRRNRPWDEFTRDLLTAKGSTFRNGATVLFRDRRTPDELTTITSQLFLGIRLECAKCHHHPFEVWGQDDFYSFAAYFAKIGRKGRGVSPPISGSEEFVMLGTKGSVEHPLTGETLAPRPLFGDAEVADGDDPRAALAAWITSPQNPFFARTMANRVWSDLMGRGLVEPVDDLRATNPPSNGPLLVALGDDFRDHDFDLKHLVRRIANSYVYGLSSLPNDRNVADTRNHSRHYRRRARAEVLLDAITDVTGVAEKFEAMPPGSMAKSLWTHRIDSDFLDAFGRPDPNQDPPCERTDDTTVVQALHLMNARNLARKVTSDDGRAAELAKSDRTPDEIVETLYLLLYARFPNEEERQLGSELFETDGGNRRTATEDLMWALINTPEFVFED